MILMLLFQAIEVRQELGHTGNRQNHNENGSKSEPNDTREVEIHEPMGDSFDEAWEG